MAGNNNNNNVVVEPTDAHTHTVIFLHGRDSHSQEFADEFFESEIGTEGKSFTEAFPSFRWVFPGAPTLRSQRFDVDMSQWFDMWSVENPHEQAELQRPGLDESIIIIRDVIKQEEKDLPRHKIFLCGISQGFATVLATYLSLDHERSNFAGLVGLCSWMPPACAETISRHREGPPVFISHSIDDEVVPISHGRRLGDLLVSRGLEVTWREYGDGGHWINEPHGVVDMAEFFNRHK